MNRPATERAVLACAAAERQTYNALMKEYADRPQCVETCKRRLKEIDWALRHYEIGFIAWIEAVRIITNSEERRNETEN